VVIAHQGGWDELLLVALPVALFAALLFVANRKAQSQLEAEEAREAAVEHDRPADPR
jgi:hypothetical protein